MRVVSTNFCMHHTDAEREWAYDRYLKVGRLDKALELARTAQDWTIVDMATDWNIVFLFQRDTARS